MAANLAGMAFIPYYNHIMKVLDTDEELKKSVKGIFQQMMYPAAGACVGGVVAGPPGAMIGGIAGSVYGYMTVDPYDNLIKVIRSLNDEEKAELVKRVQEMVGASTIEGLTAFLATQVNREIFASLIREFAAQKQGG